MRDAQIAELAHKTAKDMPANPSAAQLAGRIYWALHLAVSVTRDRAAEMAEGFK